MLINGKHYKKGSPEVVALEATTSHFFLFVDRDMKEVIKRSQKGDTIDAELQKKAQEMDTKSKPMPMSMKAYVR